MHRIKQNARHHSHRVDSNDSGWSKMCIPYARPCDTSSDSSGRRPLTAEPAEIDLESATYNQNGTSKELPADEAAQAGTARDPYRIPSQTRQETGGTFGSDDSEQTKLGGGSPTEKDSPSGDASGDRPDYYDRSKSFASGKQQQSEPKPRSRWQRMLGKGKKGDEEDLNRTNTSESKQKKHFGLIEQLRVVLLGSWINVLLICVPIGIALHVAEVNPYAAFAVNFIAIIPLAGILSYATEELSLRVGETLGGLLNASFGNAVELIVSIIALLQDKIIIVQTSLIGSILSNLLLVLGMAFFLGGIKRMEQFFNITVAQTASSLLALAIGTLLIPTTFLRFGTGGTYAAREGQIPALSRGLAVILLLVYLAYLFFQLKSHTVMFSTTGDKGSARPQRDPAKKSKARKMIANAVGHNQAAHAGGPPDQAVKEAVKGEGEVEQTEEEEKEEPRLSVIGAVLTLVISTVFVGVNSEFMVDGIAPVAEYISPEFIGLILIPIVGNAAEHVTAVTVAIKDKMDLSIGVAVGSSMQIALLVLPLIVIIGWIAGIDDMTLEFDGFLLTVVFVAVLLVNYLIGDGRSHWLEGVMLIALYIIIAVAAYLYPADPSVVA